MYIPYIVSQHEAEISVQWTCSCVKLIEPPAWGGKQGTNAYVQPLFISHHLSHCISCLPTPGPTPLPPLTLFPAPALWRPFSFMELTNTNWSTWLRFSSLCLSLSRSHPVSVEEEANTGRKSLFRLQIESPSFFPLPADNRARGHQLCPRLRSREKWSESPLLGFFPLGEDKRFHFLESDSPFMWFLDFRGSLINPSGAHPSTPPLFCYAEAANGWAVSFTCSVLLLDRFCLFSVECCSGMFSHGRLLMGLDQEGEVLSRSVTSRDDLSKR